MLSLRQNGIAAFFLLALSACGGGNGNGNGAPAAPLTPGGCAAGSVYSTQYGCMSQAGCAAGMAMYQGRCISVGNTVMSNCQASPNGSPTVYTAQYGCLPQGNCPVGQGSIVIANVNQCVPASSSPTGGVLMGPTTGCPAAQVMTSLGCLPQASCPQGMGFISGRCTD